MAILGAKHGPRASSLIAEIGKDDVLAILFSYLKEVSMRTDHLPFPMPERAYSLDQEWKFLTFMHWEVVDPKKLAKFVPDGLEIDLYDGRAYIGVIPFIMTNVRPRIAFSVPGLNISRNKHQDICEEEWEGWCIISNTEGSKYGDMCLCPQRIWFAV